MSVINPQRVHCPKCGHAFPAAFAAKEATSPAIDYGPGNYDLASLEARKAIAAKYGQAHGLDPLLIAAVCEQESSWNPFAVRFEPGFLARYVKPVKPLEPTTMEITRACSFGLMQIMGEVAIEWGWRGQFLTELCDPELGMEFGCRKLKQCLDRRDGIVPDALLYYNGGGNSYYPSQVMARMSKYA